VIIIVGAPGAPEFESQFRQTADQWQAAAERASAEVVRIGESDQAGATDHDRLRAALSEKGKNGREPLWFVMIGHGTFDGHEAKFNLRGPDVTDQELATWLANVQRPVAAINCASGSGPFVNRLSAPNRIVITATRSGSELNFARFGECLGDAIGDPHSDLDKDGQVSLLEAFLTASHRVQEYYKTRAQLATEHSLIDDNGDGLGTPADWFQGVRATRRAKDGASADGLRAHQLHLVMSDRERKLAPETRRKRDEIEIRLASLRDQKAKLGDDEYYRQLEPLMLELARLYKVAPAAAADARAKGR
jgi:hypothetical protein